MLKSTFRDPCPEHVMAATYIAIAIVVCIVAAALATRLARARRTSGDLKGLEHLRSLSLQEFAKLLGEGFRRRGYSVTESTDAGIDFLLQDTGGKYVVCCRQWTLKSVGVKPLRELVSVMRTRRGSGGFFVSAGVYTREAATFAAENGINLLDGPALEEIMLDAQAPEPFLDPTERKREKTGIFARADMVKVGTSEAGRKPATGH
jgi:HJR/Mrr/RecB family endonuclease